MSFTQKERAQLASLADILIPAGDGQLSASQADVAGEGLDKVLATCPELAAGLHKLLSNAEGRAASQAVAEMQSSDLAAFAMLAEFAAAAYFLNPAVRQAIGYGGQTARPIDPHPDYLDNGLLDSVIRRGPIYRPTPSAAP